MLHICPYRKIAAVTYSFIDKTLGC